ncbi:F0F1 ATP synthase subunit B [Rariglobus hedericola]|uniref:ATP synthase subunit b n=1 Tax=Rariglobus hedericola TaxID=2597822 RepID=A0A556QJ28_9BACT|nr:F0F1 ATP synthase subunit B [Rariglobus hedericola]TSJ76627.1 F0F1 ATP synthase subunit B [Rariglobus hedericola]
MLSLLLAAANPAVETAHDAHAHAGTEGGLVHDLVTKFGIDGVNVGMQLLSFTILAVVLYQFAIKPIIATMDERNAKIDAGLKNAEATAAQLAAAQAQAATQLKDAQLAANKIIDEARKTAKELSEREAAASTERAAAQLAKAQQAIGLEHKKMLDDARTEIARLVVATTERVLAKKLSDADRAGYNEAAARELTTV